MDTHKQIRNLTGQPKRCRKLGLYYTETQVFFKEAKQLLGLGRGLSNIFDAQIADATITMVQHILLTMRYRVENDESMGGLFSNVKETAFKQRLDQRLWGLFVELMPIIAVLFEDIDEQELLEKIFQNEKVSQMLNHILRGEPSQITNAA